MLVITRAVFDIVQIPGQQPLVVAKDAGDEAARQWWDEHVRAAAAGVFGGPARAGTSSWPTGRRPPRSRWARNGCTTAGPGWRWPGSAFPDGTDGLVNPAAAHDYITEEFRARFPQPTVAAQFADWREAVQIAELHTWTGWLFQGAERIPVDIGLPAAEFGYPIREVLACLDRLAADGWQIVHVSEDRAGHHPPDGELSSENGVSTVRYLLSRAVR